MGASGVCRTGGARSSAGGQARRRARRVGGRSGADGSPGDALRRITAGRGDRIPHGPAGTGTRERLGGSGSWGTKGAAAIRVRLGASRIGGHGFRRASGRAIWSAVRRLGIAGGGDRRRNRPERWIAVNERSLADS